jgi:mRNA interferase RelE/StbE
MASYKVTPKPSVEKDLRSLSKTAIARVVKSLDRLAEEPFPRQALKLEGGEGLYRLRVGDYRVIYSVNQEALEIIVHHVRHRREVYRTL